MTLAVEAVYEGGVLRLVQPIQLPEGTRVEVVVTVVEPSSGDRRPAAILSRIAAMPMSPGGASFSAREHDQVLYGDTDAR